LQRGGEEDPRNIGAELRSQVWKERWIVPLLGTVEESEVHRRKPAG
jgi:hypothetical protein